MAFVVTVAVVDFSVDVVAAVAMSVGHIVSTAGGGDAVDVAGHAVTIWVRVWKRIYFAWDWRRRGVCVRASGVDVYGEGDSRVVSPPPWSFTCILLCM